jgi:hypothetical protein
MKKVKITVAVIASLLVILLPLSLILFLMLSIPPQFGNTFVGALDEKYDRLYSIEEPKIVVVGGSSVAFGLESELIEKYMHMPVVNFGLYADLGTKIMLDLSEDAIGEGDIVVLAPELDKQTLSMFFNAPTTLKATDDKPEMLKHLRGDDIFATLGCLFAHLGEKYDYYENGAPDPSGVYNGKNFNEYGDLEYRRTENVMSLTYDANKLIELDIGILAKDFAEYLNEYAAKLRAKGAEVYFSWCPMNKAALAPGTTDESIEAFEDAMTLALDIDFISEIDDYILGAGYFYDTNFHLNDAGSQYRTLRLIEDLMLATGKAEYVYEPYPEEPKLQSGTIMIPDPEGPSVPENPDKPTEPGSPDTPPATDNPPAPPALDPDLVENCEYFTYTVNAQGNLEITGLTEAGKAQKELTVPVYAKLKGDTQRRAVIALCENALLGSACEKLTVQDSYFDSFRNGCFNGASNLKALYIYIFDAEAVTPPQSFDGTHGDFKIYAPDNSDYTAAYFWMQVKGIRELVVFMEE